MRFYRSSPSVYTVAFAFGVGRQAADRLTPSKAEQCGLVVRRHLHPSTRGACAAAKSRRPLLPMLGRTEGTAAAAARSKKRRMPEEERADGGAPSGKRRKNVRGDASNASGQAAGQALSPSAVIKRRKGRNLCEHQRERSQCKDCGGSGLCEHQRQRSKCKDCGGSSICEHQRRRSTCKDCREFKDTAAKGGK